MIFQTRKFYNLKTLKKAIWILIAKETNISHLNN